MSNPNLIFVKSFLSAHIFTTQKLTVDTLTEFSDSYLRKNKNTVLKKNIKFQNSLNPYFINFDKFYGSS